MAEGFINKIANEVNGESKVHDKVQDILNKVSMLRAEYENKLPPQAFKAATALIHDLRIILEKDSNDPKSLNMKTQRKLADSCVNIFSKYQPSLECAPGFWNQLKAMINVFIENIGLGKKFFKTVDTEISQSSGYRSLKDEIRTLSNNY